ncbi:hypothetical protein RRG08_064055 [Elysia crispata]|uniref:Uncharacterized protein n=1 Tax=Elysia crispata TaxID=231223 RepID=A0AAE1CY41_9GAST|nr:hypothetical protein RRG08_064055 [Elysia crispata]
MDWEQNKKDRLHIVIFHLSVHIFFMSYPPRIRMTQGLIFTAQKSGGGKNSVYEGSHHLLSELKSHGWLRITIETRNEKRGPSFSTIDTSQQCCVLRRS